MMMMTTTMTMMMMMMMMVVAVISLVIVNYKGFKYLQSQQNCSKINILIGHEQ